MEVEIMKYPSQDIGPVRLLLVTVEGYLRPLVSWPEQTTEHGDEIAPAIVLLTVRKIGDPPQQRYVTVPLTYRGREASRLEMMSILANAWLSLEYLMEHPEIKEL